jgi:hypothetical protein
MKRHIDTLGDYMILFVKPTGPAANNPKTRPYIHVRRDGVTLFRAQYARHGSPDAAIQACRDWIAERLIYCRFI